MFIGLREEFKNGPSRCLVQHRQVHSNLQFHKKLDLLNCSKYAIEIVAVNGFTIQFQLTVITICF